jgi:hypothetical protein
MARTKQTARKSFPGGDFPRKQLVGIRKPRRKPAAVAAGAGAAAAAVDDQSSEEDERHQQQAPIAVALG